MITPLLSKHSVNTLQTLQGIFEYFVPKHAGFINPFIISTGLNGIDVSIYLPIIILLALRHLRIENRLLDHLYY